MPSSPPHWAGLSGLLGELLEELLGWRDTEKAQPLPASALHPAQSWDPPPPAPLSSIPRSPGGEGDFRFFNLGLRSSV